MPNQIKVTWKGTEYTFDLVGSCYYTESGGIGDLYLDPGVAWTLELSNLAPDGPSTGTRAEPSIYGDYSNDATVSSI